MSFSHACLKTSRSLAVGDVDFGIFTSRWGYKSKRSTRLKDHGTREILRSTATTMKLVSTSGMKLERLLMVIKHRNDGGEG
jgi:hypothetical protein